MSTRVVRYRPAYFSGFDHEEATVQGLSGLLAIPWVASWARDPNFHRFSIADQHLMAELKGGREFWVAAYFPEGKPVFLELPDWIDPNAKTGPPDDESYVKLDLQ